MTAPVHHSQSSVRLFGGEIEDYLHLHEWMDATKVAMGDYRHRAIRHHALGIAEGVEKFGSYLVNSEGKKVAVRYILEQHVLEDCGGRLPTVEDWLKHLVPQGWMARAQPTKLGQKRTMEKDSEEMRNGH